MQLWLRPTPDPPAAPDRAEGSDLVTSVTCRPCHPGAYASWHRTYHRTMTQAATPEAVLGDFSGRSLADGTRLDREGEAFFATRSGVRQRIVMTTGSHHMQNYWVRHDNGLFLQLPWVWLIADRAWIRVQDSFLAPPVEETPPPTVWNANCATCHALGAAPGMQEEGADTKVAELGITCEACHGPGEAHVRKQRTPWTRYLAALDPGADETIVQPGDLPPERANAVCGRCHAAHLLQWAAEGPVADPFRPGEALEPMRALVDLRPNPVQPRAPLVAPTRGRRPKVMLRHPEHTRPIEVRGAEGANLHFVDGPRSPALASVRFRGIELAGVFHPTPAGGWLEAERGPEDAIQHIDRLLGYSDGGPSEHIFGGFWDDGVNRTVGRELSSMEGSACMRGELSCLSCHSMHDADPNDLLARDKQAEGACSGCHPEEVAAPEAHSHHASGASCLDCHMPYTTYGLLRAQRSHRIDSPDPGADALHGRVDLTRFPGHPG